MKANKNTSKGKSIFSRRSKTEAAAPETAANGTIAQAAEPVRFSARPVVAAAAKPAVATATAVAPVVAPVATAVAAPIAAQTGRDRTAIVSLISRLRDTDADVARDAATTLGTLPADAEAVDALAQVLVNFDGYFHPVTRAAAAAALGRLGNPVALDALIVATRDTMAEASEEAVRALGLLGDSRAIPTLRAVVTNADGFYLENVRKTAAESLHHLTVRL